jgi:hypothetical protein
MTDSRRCNARGRHGIDCKADAIYICTATDGRMQWFACEAHSQVEPGRRDSLTKWLAWIHEDMCADIAAEALAEPPVT